MVKIRIMIAVRYAFLLAVASCISVCSTAEYGAEHEVMCEKWYAGVIEGSSGALKLSCRYECSQTKDLCEIGRSVAGFPVKEYVFKFIEWIMPEDELSSIRRKYPHVVIVDSNNDGVITIDDVQEAVLADFRMNSFWDEETSPFALMSSFTEAFLSIRLGIKDITLVVWLVTCLVFHQALNFDYPVILKVLFGLLLGGGAIVEGTYMWLGVVMSLHFLTIDVKATVQYGNLIPFLVVLMFIGAAIRNAVVSSVVCCFLLLVFAAGIYRFWARPGAQGRANDLSMVTGALVGVLASVEFLSLITVNVFNAPSMLMVFFVSSSVPMSETGGWSFVANAVFMSSAVVRNMFLTYTGGAYVRYVKLTLFLVFLALRFGFFIGFRSMIYARLVARRPDTSMVRMACVAYAIDPFRPILSLWHARSLFCVNTWVVFVVWCIPMFAEMRYALDIFAIRVVLMLWFWCFDTRAFYVRTVTFMTAGAYVDEFVSPGALPDISVEALRSLCEATGSITMNGIRGSMTVIREGKDFIGLTALHVIDKMDVGSEVTLSLPPGEVEARLVEKPGIVRNDFNDGAATFKFTVRDAEAQSVVKEVARNIRAVDIRNANREELQKLTHMLLFKGKHAVQPVLGWTVYDRYLELKSAISRGDSGSLVIGVLPKGDIVRVGVVTHGRRNAMNIVSLMDESCAVSDIHTPSSSEDEADISADDSVRSEFLSDLLNGRVHVGPCFQELREKHALSIERSGDEKADRDKRKNFRKKMVNEMVKNYEVFYDIGEVKLAKILQQLEDIVVVL